MTIDLETLTRLAFSTVPVLLDATVKATVLLLAAAVAALALRKVSASARQMVWVLALAGLIVLPLASAALPSWAILPGWATFEMPTELVESAPSAPISPAPDEFARTDSFGGADRTIANVPAAAPDDVPQPAASLTPAAAVAPALPREPDAATAAQPDATRSWQTWAAPSVVFLWLAGTLVCLLPIVLGRLSLWRLARRSRRITDGSWAMLARRAASAIGLRRPVAMLQSSDEPMPMVWGTLRAKLLLPADADDWSAQRRWVVLLHELAHVKRRDCLAKFVAHVACSLYWFNPLCWIAFRQMQREAETACDDLVLSSRACASRAAEMPSVRPSDYAQHLLEIASGLKSGMLVAYSSIAMARKSKLEGRLLAILDGNRNRRSLTRIGIIVATVVVAAIAMPLACLRATQNDSPAAAQPTTLLAQLARSGITPASTKKMVFADDEGGFGFKTRVEAAMADKKAVWKAIAIAKPFTRIAASGYRRVEFYTVADAAKPKAILLVNATDACRLLGQDIKESFRCPGLHKQCVARLREQYQRQQRASTQPAGKPSVGIYLITGRRKGAASKELSLADFTLADKPLIGKDDIFEYDWESHTIRLKKQAVADRILKRGYRRGMGAFVVVANGRRLYRGSFLSMLSSVVPTVPVIHVGPSAEQFQPKMAIRIHRPPLTGSPDPRNDARLKQALQALKLLRQVGTATQPAAAQPSDQLTRRSRQVLRQRLKDRFANLARLKRPREWLPDPNDLGKVLAATADDAPVRMRRLATTRLLKWADQKKVLSHLTELARDEDASVKLHATQVLALSGQQVNVDFLRNIASGKLVLSSSEFERDDAAWALLALGEKLPAAANNHSTFFDKTLEKIRALQQAGQDVSQEILSEPGERAHPATQPAGSKLEFRVAPKPSDIDKRELADYMRWLKTGKVGFWYRTIDITGRMPDRAWLPVAAELTNATQLVTGEYQGEKYVLVSDKSEQTMVSGAAKDAWGLEKVYATKGGSGRPAIGFELDDRGAKRFAALTKANVGNHLAIVVDGKVVSAPKLMSAFGKRGMIAGQFTEQEAAALVEALGADREPGARAKSILRKINMISGRAVDAAGKPLAGVEIRLTNPQAIPERAKAISCQTDSRGAFKLESLEWETADLAATQRNYRSDFRKSVPVGTRDLVIRLGVPASYKLSGKVLDPQGRPVSEAEVALADREHRIPGREPVIVSVRTGPDGRFQFEQSFDPLGPEQPRSRTLIVRKPGWALWAKELDSTGGQTNITARLAKPARLAGVVTDEQGKPLAGASVRLTGFAWGSGESPFQWHVRDLPLTPRTMTDKAGSFVLNGLPSGGVIGVYVTRPGYECKMNWGIDMTSGTTELQPGLRPRIFHPAGKRLTIALARAAVLRGTITYEGSGKPAAGVMVAVQGRETSSWSQAISDSAGRFELDDVRPEPGNLKVLLRHERTAMPEWTAKTLVFDQLKPGQKVDDLKVTLTKGGVIRGRITDGLGRPLKGANVAFYSAARPRAGTGCQSVYSADDGTWAFRFPPGEVYLYVSGRNPDLPGNWKEGSKAVQLKAGQTLECDFQLNDALPDDSPFRATPVAPATQPIAVTKPVELRYRLGSTFWVDNEGITVIHEAASGNPKTGWTGPHDGRVEFDSFSLRVDQSNRDASGRPLGMIMSKEGKAVPVAWRIKGDLADWIREMAQEQKSDPHWGILLSDAEFVTIKEVWRALPPKGRHRLILLVRGKVSDKRRVLPASQPAKASPFAGLKLRLVPADKRKQYRIGETIKFDVFAENTGKQAVKFSLNKYPPTSYRNTVEGGRIRLHEFFVYCGGEIPEKNFVIQPGRSELLNREEYILMPPDWRGNTKGRPGVIGLKPQKYSVSYRLFPRYTGQTRTEKLESEPLVAIDVLPGDPERIRQLTTKYPSGREVAEKFALKFLAAVRKGDAESMNRMIQLHPNFGPRNPGSGVASAADYAERMKQSQQWWQDMARQLRAIYAGPKYLPSRLSETCCLPENSPRPGAVVVRIAGPAGLRDKYLWLELSRWSDGWRVKNAGFADSKTSLKKLLMDLMAEAHRASTQPAAKSSARPKAVGPWITIAPRQETIASIEDLRILYYGLNLPIAVGRSGTWEIRTADQRTIATVPVRLTITTEPTEGVRNIWSGARGLDKEELKRIGQLPDGEYRLAWKMGGKRLSNVMRFRIKKDYEPREEPLLSLKEIASPPGEIPFLIIRAYRHNQRDPAPRASEVAYATLNVDGRDLFANSREWAGTDYPLKVGRSYAYLVNLNRYADEKGAGKKYIQLGRKHVISAKAGPKEDARGLSALKRATRTDDRTEANRVTSRSAPMTLAYDRSLCLQWDRAAGNQTQPAGQLTRRSRQVLRQRLKSQFANLARLKRPREWLPDPNNVDKVLAATAGGSPVGMRRLAATRLLEWADQKKVLSRLAELKRDEDPFVKLHATQVLALAGRRENVDFLRDIASGRQALSSSEFERDDAA